jgi:hypothetical protein
MKAVLCLIRIFFTASPLLCGGTLLGLALLLFGTLGYAFMPEWTIARPQSWETQWLESVVLVLPWLGLILLLAAGALMPVIVERIALGRGVWLLPHGRRRLLVATVLPAAVLALLTAVAALAALRVLSLDIVFGRFFWRTWLMAYVDISLIYTAMWFVSKTSGVWRLAGLICVVISITIPVRYLGSGFEAISLLEVLGLVCWIAFGIAVLAGGRLRHGLAGRRNRLAARWRRMLPGGSYAAGSEAALLLGTTRP